MFPTKGNKNENTKEKGNTTGKSSEITRIVRPTQTKIIRRRLFTTISPRSTVEHRTKRKIFSTTTKTSTKPLFKTTKTAKSTPTTASSTTQTPTITTETTTQTPTPTITKKIKVGLTENIPLALLQSNENSDDTQNIILNKNDEKKQKTHRNDLTKKTEGITNKPSRTSTRNVSIKALSCHFNRMIAYLDVRNIKDNFNIYLKNSSCKYFVNTLNIVQDTIELPINYNDNCGTILKEHGSHSTYVNKLYFEKGVDGVLDERSHLTVKCRLKNTDRTDGQMHAKLKKSGK